MIVHRRADDLQAWHLTDQSAMVDALTALKAFGWRGAISYDATTDTWRLELNKDQPTRQIIASLDDWLVNDIELNKLSGVDFDNYYES